MKRFDDKHITGKVHAFSRLADVRPSLLTQRLTYLSQMDGQPLGTHVIGAMQRAFDLSSWTNLLTSMHKLAALMDIAGTTILNLQGARTDRYILVKDEILAYVRELISTTGGTGVALSDDDYDFIVRALIQNEADPTAWTLWSGSEASTNIHLRTAELYRTILTGSLGAEIALYDYNSITTPLNAQPAFIALPNESADEASMRKKQLDYAAVVHSIAAARVVDHVHNLMMELDVWYQFVTPRHDGKSAAANIERGKGLQRMAAYCRGLLTYSTSFSMECILHTYEYLGSWVGFTPELPKRIRLQIERVRAQDIFKSKEDVATLLAPCATEYSSPVCSNITFFPMELVMPMGMHDTFLKVAATAKKYDTTLLVTDLKSLTSGKLLPLLSTSPLETLDAKISVAKALNYGSDVADIMKATFEALIETAATDMYKDVQAAVAAMDFRAHQPFSVPLLTHYKITSGVAQHLRGGTLSVDPAAVTHSLAYQRLLTDKYLLTVFTENNIFAAGNNLRPLQIVNEDRAAYFRDLLEVQYRSFQPHTYAYEPTSLDPAEYRSNSDSWRTQIEYIANTDLPTFIVKMRAKGNVTALATAISGAGLLYQKSGSFEYPTLLTSNSSFKDASEEEIPLLLLVEGEGNPFGTTYQALAALQDAQSNPNPFLQIAENVYFRFHSVIPVVTQSLVKVKTFMAGRSALAFESNGQHIEVSRWVKALPMWDHCLIPYGNSFTPPIVVFSKRAVYYNRIALIHADPIFQLSSPEAARITFDVSVSEKEWNFGYIGDYARYLKGPGYGHVTGSVATHDVDNEVAAAVRALEDQQDKERKEERKETNEAGQTVFQVENQVDKEKNKQNVDADI